VGQGGGLVTVDYDVPWAYAVAIAGDAEEVRRWGRRALLRLAAGYGSWLPDFVGTVMDDPAVRDAVAADARDSAARGIRSTPVVDLDGQLLGPELDPAEVRHRIDAAIATVEQGSA
jgi:hypothetical protein